MPEGDALHRAARRLQVLVGEKVTVDAPHPRAASTGVAEQLDGRRLEGVEAVGKNLVLHFEGGLVLRSHLRMRGRWTVRERGESTRGRPWLVLRGGASEAVLWGGSVLELNARSIRRLGPDILADPPVLYLMVSGYRRADGRRVFGDALVDHRTWALASDGDMMEGVASEAASLAGHLGLGKLVVIYDDNGITIDGKTSISFSEDVGKRFEAYHWDVQRVDGTWLISSLD